MNLSQIITMTVHFLETLAADFLENQNLLTLEVFQDCGLNVSTRNVGFSNLYVAIIVFKHHGVKRDLATFFVLKTVDKDLLILSDLELLSCDFYDCVHFNILFISVLQIVLNNFIP